MSNLQPMCLYLVSSKSFPPLVSPTLTLRASLLAASSFGEAETETLKNSPGKVCIAVFCHLTGVTLGLREGTEGEARRGGGKGLRG